MADSKRIFDELRERLALTWRGFAEAAGISLPVLYRVRRTVSPGQWRYKMAYRNYEKLKRFFESHGVVIEEG